MQISRRVITDVVLLVIVNTMWAAQYPAYKTASDRIKPVTVSTWTFLIAAIILLPFLVRERRNLPSGEVPSAPQNPSDPLTPQARWNWRDVLDFFILGVLGLIPASAFLAWGTDRSTAANAALIYLTIPIITALLASVMVQEKMTLARWVSLLIALAGVLILSGFDWRHLGLTSGKYAFANMLILLACTSSAFYNVGSKKLLSKFTPLEVLVYGYLTAVIASIPLLIWIEPIRWSEIRAYNGATWISLIVLSVLSWGLAMILWMYLLKRLDVSQASVSVYLLPFLGVFVSAVTLHEKITTTMIVGGAVTLAGTILVTSTEVTSATAN
jgi:drug/metabolite transporter (DMT)-like permease